MISRTLVVTALLAAASTARADVKSISQEACHARAGRLVKVIEEEKAAGHTVVYDDLAFYKSFGAPDASHGKVRLAQYINLEDGMTTIPPLRTGHEVDLYNAIKAHIIAHPSDALGPDRILAMAIEAHGSTVNLQAALLTAHNVIRLLARPGQWSGDRVDGTRGNEQVGHPDSDPARPILLDLLGRKSSSSGPTLAEAMKIPIRKEKDPKAPALPVGEVMVPEWSMKLFDKGGSFQLQPNAPNAEWNAGASYYFWIGALAQTTLGTAAVMKGITGEGGAKTEMGQKDQGAFEISHLVCGGMFGTAAFAARKSLK